MFILGLRAGHDAGACLLNGNKIIADVAEERFSRIKNDSTFPLNSINFCLEKAKISSIEIDVIAISSNSLYEEFYNFFHFPLCEVLNLEFLFHLLQHHISELYHILSYYN